MMILRHTTAFRRDVKLSRRRGLDTKKLETVIDLLLKEAGLPLRYRDHTLTGNWRGHRECHIEPDWLLIYIQTEDELVLVRTGTHADLFAK